jgi:WD40 repeat protein
MLCVRSRLALLALLALAAPASAALPPHDVHGDLLPDGATTRLGTMRLRHGDGVCHVLYSADRKWLVSLSRDRTCRVWEADTGRLRHLFAERDVDYYAVAFTPDGTTLAAAGGDPFHGGNNGVRLFDLATGQETGRLAGHHQPAYALGFTPDGKTLLSVSCDQVIRWDVATGNKLTEWKLHTTAALSLSPNRTTVAWVDGETEDRSVHLSDAATGKETARLTKGHKRSIVSVCWSPDGKHLASGNTYEPIALWDVAAGKVVQHFEQEQSGLALRFSADGKTLAAGCNNGSVRLWDVDSGDELKPLKGYNGWVNCLAFAPDGKTLALAGSDSQVIHRWDVATATAYQPGPGHHGQIYSIAFAPGGRLVATGGGDWHDNDQSIYLWDPATGKQVRRLEGHIAKVHCVRFAPDGKTLVSGGEKENALRRWDVATGKELPRWRVPGGDEGPVVDGRVSALAYSPDGKLLASAHDQGILHLWDVAEGKVLRSFQGHEGIVHAVAFSVDGKYLVSGSVDRTVRLWDVATGAEVRGFGDAVETVKCVAFSPDGRLIAASTGDYDGTIHVWETATGRELARLAATRGRVYQVAFSPDGKLLAGTGPDNALCVWEVATRQERCRFPGHPNGGLAVAFAPDGKHVASGSADTTVVLWNVSYCAEVERPRGTDDLERLWTELGSDDARAAHRAMCALLSDPAKALPLLQKRLRPISAMDADRLARVLNDLDSQRYPVRDKANNELAKLGELAEPFLRQTLQAPPSLEVKRRVQILLTKLETSTLAPEQLRALRGFEILERLGGTEAREVFEAHARLGGEARLGREAQACLRRLEER